MNSEDVQTAKRLAMVRFSGLLIAEINSNGNTQEMRGRVREIIQTEEGITAFSSLTQIAYLYSFHVLLGDMKFGDFPRDAGTN